ncbi:hypothetical protein [Halorientalis sp.]|jgi:hypothetical protein|nr:hypothetical protein [Halorientalis sp.]
MPADRDRETVARTREALIDERLAASIIQTERDRRAERRQRRLAAALDG